MSTFNPQCCSVCSCTDDDCSKCMKRTKLACTWVAPGLCSACVDINFPWGFDVTYTTHNGTQEYTQHKQGIERKVRRWAAMKSNFTRVVELVPITKQQWHAAYGYGDTRM